MHHHLALKLHYGQLRVGDIAGAVLQHACLVLQGEMLHRDQALGFFGSPGGLQFRIASTQVFMQGGHADTQSRCDVFVRIAHAGQ